MEVIAEVRRAVVRIETPSGVGSGTIISSDGYILTNFHVIRGYSAVTVLVQDIHTVSGNVVGYDEELDLAVVKIGGSPWSHLEVTEYHPHVGEEVIMLGYALDLPGEASVTKGVVSALRPEHGVTWIQTDAAGNPGVSGGAAVTAKGQFIGVPTWGYTEAENVGFLIALFSVVDDIPRLVAGAKVALPTATLTPTLSATYIDPTYRYRIKYPSGWYIDRSNAPNVVSFKHPSRHIAISVGVHANAAHSYTLLDFRRWSLKGLPALSVLSQRHTAIAGYRAIEMVMDVTFVAKPERLLFICMLAGDNGYLIYGYSYSGEWVSYETLLREYVYTFSP